jgi:hypothetical protein
VSEFGHLLFGFFSECGQISQIVRTFCGGREGGVAAFSGPDCAHNFLVVARGAYPFVRGWRRKVCRVLEVQDLFQQSTCFLFSVMVFPVNRKPAVKRRATTEVGSYRVPYLCPGR